MTLTRRKQPPPKPTTLRCAAYVRQSVEDATSEFGSLDAQLEAIAAYVKSQKSEGWTLLPEQYCDAGFSGKDTQRPAFQRLLADINSGKIDVVCVNRLDRLSRSLRDFTQLMDLFQERGVQFVSTTQAFNSTSSVGRLTLSLLASFAQFERETIAERTKCKVLAARRRGLWTGGPVPLGYELVESRLIPNPDEVEQVRWLYDTYLSLGSITRTIDAANKRGIHAKPWKAKDGTRVEGRPLAKTVLAHILTNPTYIGDQRAADEVVKGTHEAILPRELWESVGAQLAANHHNGGAHTKNRYGALLRGLVTCAVCGSGMSHTVGGSCRYYACARLLRESSNACPGSRVPVALLEPAVVERLRAIGRDPKLVEATIAAACAERARREPVVEADAARLERQVAQKERERANLVQALAQGGPAGLAADIERADADLEALDATVQRVRGELALLRARKIDEGELRRVLSDFDALWGAMLVHEREAVLRILVRSLTFDGRTGVVGLNGVRFTLPLRKPRARPPRRSRNAPRRGIRGARLLALIQVVETGIERGEIRDLSHAAELFGLSRARMTQVAQLSDLAPDIQERLLLGDTSIPERALRAALRSVDWTQQRAALQELT